MTCILFTKARIYTDTLHLNEANEEFHSLTKVKPLKDVCRVKWTMLTTEPMTDDFNPESFVDNIHGYTCSGNNVISNRLMDNLLKVAIGELKKVDSEVKVGTMSKRMAELDIAVDLNQILDVYKLIVEAGFVTDATMGTTILIGEKACYAVEVSSHHAFVGKISRDNPTSYGSGAPYASKVYFTTGDPLRAIYTAMWYNDSLTGGMIDIWDMPTVDMPELRRCGVCNQRSLAQIKDILALPDNPDEPLHPDLISNDIFADKMIGVANVAEQVGFERGAGFTSDPKKRSKTEVTDALKHLRKVPTKKISKPSAKKAVALRPAKPRKPT